MTREFFIVQACLFNSLHTLHTYAFKYIFQVLQNIFRNIQDTLKYKFIC